MTDGKEISCSARDLFRYSNAGTGTQTVNVLCRFGEGGEFLATLPNIVKKFMIPQLHQRGGPAEGREIVSLGKFLETNNTFRYTC